MPTARWRLLTLLCVAYICLINLPQIRIRASHSVSRYNGRHPRAPPVSRFSLQDAIRDSQGGAHCPKKIWQTWQQDSTTLTGLHKERAKTWQDQNPDFRYELLTDYTGDEFVREHYSSKAAEMENLRWIGDVYLNLTDHILKADFLRYLVLYIEGGVYADLDVECYVPIPTWADLPPSYNAASAAAHADIIVGIESDRDQVENDWLLYKDYRKHIWGITNWTFYARKAYHPFLRLVIETVARNIVHLAESKKMRSVSELKGGNVWYKEVIESSGPRAFSDALLHYLSVVEDRPITGQDARLLEEPIVIADVLILPIRSMSMLEANRVDGNGARSLNLEPIIKHWGEGTWKSSHFIEHGQKPDDWDSQHGGTDAAVSSNEINTKDDAKQNEAAPAQEKANLDAAPAAEKNQEPAPAAVSPGPGPAPAPLPPAA